MAGRRPGCGRRNRCATSKASARLLRLMITANQRPRAMSYGNVISAAAAIHSDRPMPTRARERWALAQAWSRALAIWTLTLAECSDVRSTLVMIPPLFPGCPVLPPRSRAPLASQARWAARA